MTELPEPLVPAEVDLRGLPWMPVDTVRLLDSDTFALATGDQFKAAFRLWCKAWQQKPAASLPDDDVVLASLSGTGRMWPKFRPVALRGFMKCSDGRLYHPVIAEKALEAWKHRKAQRDRANKRWSGGVPVGLDALRIQREIDARAKGTHTGAEWGAMLEACGMRCVSCGTTSRTLCKDHIKPISRGGDDTIENLQPLCHPCNASKGTTPKDMRPAGALDEVIRVCRPDAEPMPRHESGTSPAMQGREIEIVKGQDKKPTTAKSTAAAARRPREDAEAKADRNRPTRQAYIDAYVRRYTVEPTLDKRANSMLSQFVESVGADDGPGIAAFYVASNRGLYVSARHDVTLLLRDARGLRTEWLTGRQVTETEARQADKTATRGNLAAELLAENRKTA